MENSERRANRESNREKLKQTIERVAPSLDVETTKVLSDEELEGLMKETRARQEAHQMAAEVGRKGLRERLKRSIVQMERQTKPFDPEKLKELRDEKPAE